MDFSSEPAARTRTAIALSIAVHLCALALLAPHLGGVRSATNSIAANAVVRVWTIVRRLPPRHPAASPAPKGSVAAAVPAQPPLALHTVRGGVLRPGAAPRQHPRPHPQRANDGPRELAHAPSSAPLIAAITLVRPASAAPRSASRGENPMASRTAAAPAPGSDSTPQATATPGTSATAAAPNTDAGLFSQNYPPALVTPSIIDAIRRKFGGHGRIRVAVDETGQATDIRFMNPISADDAREVRAQLFALSYVPADCNGLHCDGVLEINY